MGFAGCGLNPALSERAATGCLGASMRETV
jgi:hypothetical protein